MVVEIKVCNKSLEKIADFNMKHLEDTPWWICDQEDTNYCAYMDTDSVYLDAKPLLYYLYPNFEELDDDTKDNILENIALKYQDIITSYYDKLAKECFNVPKHRLEMKTECVIRSAYFRATRRYAQWITKQEGIARESLDIKGLEFMKANFPPILGEFFNDILKQVLKGEEKASIIEQIKEFKKQIINGKIPLAKLGNPTAVKKLQKYQGTKPRAGEMFSEIFKGAPAPVRAAIRYNDLLRLWQLDRKYNLITMADKEFILDQIKVFKKQIINGKIPLAKLGNPTSVKKLDKYSGTKASAGEIFTEILKGAPAPVRAAIRYNDLLKLWQLDKKYNLITMADKVKWIYLKDNPYKIEGLAFLDYDIPKKILDFLNIYADRQKVFESILLNKLEGFFSDLEWNLDLNPHTNALSSFEI